MKKTLGLMLALVLVLALSVPVFAGQNQQGDNSQQNLDVAGSLLAVDIKIKAPTSAQLILNPYQMKYTGNIEALENSTSQILSAPVVYENTTPAKLLVSGTFIPTSVGISIVTGGTVASGDTAKKAALKVKFGMMQDDTGKWKTGVDPTEYEFPALTVGSGDTVIGSGDGMHITLKSNQSGGQTIELTAPEYKQFEVPETDGETANYFGFQFDGALTQAPDEVWTTNDKINVAVALKLTPKSLGSGS